MNRGVAQNVDIEFFLPDDKKTLTKDAIRNQAYEHLLKLWCLTLKHFHRGNKDYREEVQKLFRRVFENEVMDGKCEALLMDKILDYLADRLPTRFRSFLDKCESELGLLL